MNEQEKSMKRRFYDGNFHQRYFVGNGIDIGGGACSIAENARSFLGVKSVKVWDVCDGDAQFMEGVPDNTYDFVHSSHCLEHINDAYEAMSNWIRITKPGGFIIVTVPDEDMYEHLCWPSPHNPDHKWSFTIYKPVSKMPSSINIIDLLASFGSYVQIEKIQQIRDFWVESCDDLTLRHNPECAIEFVVSKNSLKRDWKLELQKSGILPKKITVSNKHADHPFPERYLCDGKVIDKTDKWASIESNNWVEFKFKKPIHISKMLIFHAGILENPELNTRDYNIIFGDQVIQVTNNVESFTEHLIDATVDHIMVNILNPGKDGATRIYEVKFIN